MESLSHSRPPPNKLSTKKPYNNVTSGSIYDDVFGGPPRFGGPTSTLSPRMEDYAEIFSSFHAVRASSIPVLDPPAVGDPEVVCVDVKSDRFDYTEVFGEVEDFGLSFDDLFSRANEGYDGSSDDAWTPAESDSLSEESDRTVPNRYSSNGNSYQSINGTTEFSISYHKLSARNHEEIANEETHVAQINNIPGFTCAVDKASCLKKVEAEIPSFQVADDGSHHNLDINGEMLSAKHLRKTLVHPADSRAGSETFPHDMKSQKESSNSDSHRHKPFVTISEISLKTKPSDLPPPSRPPPKLDVKKGNLKCSSKGAVLREGSANKSSPPFFDVEVDSNSSAAASAAAMKEVMEKAQARLKSAKEQMERRKDGVQCRTKSGSVDARKNREGIINKVSTQTCSSKCEMPHGISDAEDSGTKYAVREGRQISTDKTEAAQDILQEKFYDLVHRSGEERLGNISMSSQASDDIGGASEWKEATQFFELVKSDRSRKAFEQTNSANPVVPKSDDNEFGPKKKDVVMKKGEQLEGSSKENATLKDRLWEKKEKKLKETKRACEQVENNESLKVTREEHRKKDIKEKAKAACLPSEQDEKDKFRTAQQDVKSERKLDTKKKAKAASEMAENKEKPNTDQQYIRKEMNLSGYEASDDLLEIQLNEKVNEVEAIVEHTRKEKKLVDASKFMENETDQECHKGDHDERGQKKASELKENEKEVRESPEHLKTDKRQVNECKRENSNSKISETRYEEQQEACSPENGVNRMNGALLPEEKKKRQTEVFEKEEHEKKLTDTPDMEEKERRHIRSSEQRNSKILHKTEEKILNEARSGENYVQVDVVLEMTFEKGIRNAGVEKESSGQSTVHEMTFEKGIRNTGVEKESFGQSTVHEYTDEDKNKISDQVEVENLSVPIEVNMLGKMQINQANQSSQENDEVEEQLKETVEEFAPEVHGKENVAIEDGKVLKPLRKVVINNEHNISNLSESTSKNGCPQKMKQAADLQTVNENKPGNNGETWVDNIKCVSEINSRCEFYKKGPGNDGIEKQKDSAHVQVEFSDVKSKSKFMSAQVFKEPIGTEMKTDVDLPASSFGRANNQITAQQACSRPSHGRKENCHNEAVESGETEKMRRERELEEERLRKIEEEREREREREKDRMALDKETLEIREKSSGDRVAAEARQRAMTEARERLEKVCAEAREKTLSEKVLEARLRAERAAVVRATAEARARAAEKAMAERAAPGTRERMERSVSDKFFASSRTGGMGQSSSYSDSQDHQFQSASFSSNTRHQYSSAHCVRSEGVEVESAQRCKARLERHRRTAERAAKALAEKNMRDLIVQREQAERSRLAETLDADVKRWSSGKQGNLRALLSTLQYILGAESGWQPIPLTEVITSAAVKKAYRKATLCVHPDKLQQRGASIQQKYISEKVFDLLKEAWTKFNSEER